MDIGDSRDVPRDSRSAGLLLQKHPVKIVVGLLVVVLVLGTTLVVLLTRGDGAQREVHSGGGSSTPSVCEVWEQFPVSERDRKSLCHELRNPKTYEIMFSGLTAGEYFIEKLHLRGAYPTYLESVHGLSEAEVAALGQHIAVRSKRGDHRQDHIRFLVEKFNMDDPFANRFANDATMYFEHYDYDR